ncbi:MAG: polysaccharide biosynthesis/export family protein [Planctomycetes bacterium]|nr:polysaccharide biosynthesis/export family protein [Planctomycetota bacterium]
MRRRFRRGAALCLLGLPLMAGCAASRPLEGLDVEKLPPGYHAVGDRGDRKTIDLSLLRQTPPIEYRVDAGDVLGVFVEGVLGGDDQVPPVYVPQDHSLPPSLGYPIAIRGDGSISLPLRHPIVVSGLTLRQVEETIRSLYSRGQGDQPPLLNQGNERVIVSLQRPRTARVLVIRQEEGNDEGNGPLIDRSSVRQKRGTGRVVELPAYRNDVLNALAETGGLPGIDAENVVYVIRGARRLPIEVPAPERMDGVAPPPPQPEVDAAPQPLGDGPNMDAGAPADELDESVGLRPPLATSPIQLVGHDIHQKLAEVDGLDPRQLRPDAADDTDAFLGQTAWGRRGRIATPDKHRAPDSIERRLQQADRWTPQPLPRQPAPLRTVEAAPAIRWAPPVAVPVREPVPVSDAAVAVPVPETAPLPIGTDEASELVPLVSEPSPVPEVSTGPAIAPQSPRLATRGLGPAGGRYAAVGAAVRTGEPHWPDVTLINDATIASPRVVRIPLRLGPGEFPTFGEQDIILYDGDVVFVESRETDFFMTGGLLGGAQFPLPRDYDITVIDAIAMAEQAGANGNRPTRALGGVSALNQDVTVGASKVIVLRQRPDGCEVPIEIDLYRAIRHPEERVVIQPGDRIILQYTRLEACGAFFERHIFDPLVVGLSSGLVFSN